MSRREPAGPVGEDEFDRAFAPLAAEAAIVVAVSGGPDSICLLHALAAWAGRGPDRPCILAATIDHGLRAESRAEAEAVARVAAGLGVPHEILTWRDPPAGRRPSQAASRTARYGLLAAFVRSRDASALAVAHTADDQAETVLLRLAAGSGPGGLAAMRPVSMRAGTRILRPLLDLPKARLVATCRENGWSFVDDPSNADPASERVRWRAIMPLLAAEGLDASRLARLARRMARAEEALEAAAGSAAESCGLVRTTEGASCDAAALLRHPDEIALRVLARAAAPAEPAPHAALRLARLEAALDALRGALGEGRPLRRTLAGRLLTLDPTGRLVVVPEPPRRRGRPSFTSIAAATPHSLGIPSEDA